MSLNLSPMHRFLRRVEIHPGGCWLWLASVQRAGYGQIMINYKNLLAHRLAYELFVGPIPPGLTIDHLCRNRRCVNPDHLEAVSYRENTLRGTSPVAAQAKQTHCKRGHEFTDENTYTHRGMRYCRACGRARKRVEYHNARIRWSDPETGPGPVA